MTDRTTSLDCLRGVLSLLVVMAHGWQILVHPSDLGATTWASYAFGLSARLAVIAFFTLSGFVIALTIAANVERHGSFLASEYAFARLFRIGPPLLLVIALTLVLQLALSLLDAQTTTAKGAARAAFTTDVPNQLFALVTLGLRGQLTGAWLNGPLWSLIFEIQLYVIAGLVAVVSNGSNWRWRLLAGLLLGLYLHALARGQWWFIEMSLQTMSFAAFAAGALAYRYRAAPAAAVVAVGLAALALMALRYSQVQVPILEGLDTDNILLACQVALAISCAAAVVLVARGRPWRFFRASAAYSYTLYIGHFPALLAVYFLLANKLPWLVLPPLAPITAVCAVLLVWALLAKLGRWVERPRVQRKSMARMLDTDLRELSRTTGLGALALAASAAMVSAGNRPGPLLQLFGDSTQVLAYPLLKDRLGRAVQNNAVGDTRSDMLLSGRDGLNDAWPLPVVAPIVIVNHGMNEARPWARVSVASYKENLRRLAMVDARVIFETPNPSTYPGRDVAPYAQAMHEVAQELGLQVIDVHACFKRQHSWELRLPDGVHPDIQGLRWIVDECLIPELRGLLELRPLPPSQTGTPQWVSGAATGRS